MDGRGADIGSDGIHPRVVAFAQRVVVGRIAGRARQFGRQAGLGERPRDDRLEILVALVVDAGAHRGVQRSQRLSPMGLLGGDGHPNRSPRLCHQLLILLG